MHDSTETPRLPFAIVACACLLPAATFIGAAVGRQLQPTEFELAPMLQTTFDWFAGIGIPGLVVLLLALPAIGTAIGAGLVLSSVRADAGLRSDLAGLGSALLRILRRPTFLLAIIVTVFGLCYFAMVAVHAVAG
jgi:hypothetical protein